ncbi:MAG: NADH-quinone oxidoreductase subunit N [Cytophagales bacterium]|nr:MAG: NADH-quinone oxidoreductase subunit N [Cytophagales bacterium]TAF60977.1 MAG: NADH-quinone oxidoreductase subunit N [Cytophagales bacterium]
MVAITLLSVFGMITLFLGFNKSKTALLPFALVFLFICLVGNLYEFGQPLNYFSQMMQTTPVSVVFSSVILLAALLTLPLSSKYLTDERAQPAEYYAILMFSLVGAIMMTNFENIIMLFVGIEILSISMYVLAGSDKRNTRSNEAALKYFLMGAFATGILLFGVAMLYGATGSFSVSGLAQYISANAASPSPLLILGLCLVLVGVLFKVSAAPFHFWTPDVYEGAPTFFTTFMSTVVKTAGFAAAYKLLSVTFIDMYLNWCYIVGGVAVLTLLISNISAVYQDSFKRMMAYSSISHAGYLLIAILAVNAQSQSAILFYALAYTTATVAAFGVLMKVSEQYKSESFTAFEGLAKQNPFLAFVLAVAMCSLAGIPLTAGFVGKLMVFLSAVESGYIGLIVIAVLMAVVGIYYYFKVIIAAYMRQNANAQTIELDTYAKVTLALATLLTFLFGIAPNLILSLI